jgi:hypothetical protein
METKQFYSDKLSVEEEFSTKVLANAESVLDEIFNYGHFDEETRKKYKELFQMKCFGEIIWQKEEAWR